MIEYLGLMLHTSVWPHKALLPIDTWLHTNSIQLLAQYQPVGGNDRPNLKGSPVLHHRCNKKWLLSALSQHLTLTWEHAALRTISTNGLSIHFAHCGSMEEIINWVLCVCNIHLLSCPWQISEWPFCIIAAKFA